MLEIGEKINSPDYRKKNDTWRYPKTGSQEVILKWYLPVKEIIVPVVGEKDLRTESQIWLALLKSWKAKQRIWKHGKI